MVLPKTEGTPIDEPEKKIPEPMGTPPLNLVMFYN